MTPLQAAIVVAEVDCIMELVAVDNMKILEGAYKTREERQNNVENKLKVINELQRFLICQEELLKIQKLSSNRHHTFHRPLQYRT